MRINISRGCYRIPGAASLYGIMLGIYWDNGESNGKEHGK